MYKLTEGALDKIMDGIDIEKPVVQVLGHKKLTSSSSDRYRLLVSDGLRTNSFTMLATQLNNLITNNILTEFTVCELSKYALSSVNNGGKEKRVIIILEVQVIASGDKVGHKIGNPSNMSKAETETAKPNLNPSTAAYHHNSNGTMQKNASSHHSSSEISTTPIAALSPYQNKWVIKVRVLTKSQIRTWSNSRGDGKLFTIELVDESGEIRCTAFNKECDKFYDMIEAGNVYYISRCSLKPANKQYNTMKNDFEMSMTSDTEVVLCHDNNEDIPTLQFNFSPISQLETMKKDETIDVLGVVTTCSELQTVSSRNTGKEHMKRDINIVDDSGVMVCVTLWGKQAEEFDGSDNPIVAIKGARIGEFNGGKNLSIGISGIIQKNPDLQEAHRLRGWYAKGGNLENAKSLSRAGGGGGDVNAPLYTFQEVTDAKLGERMNAADVFSVVATINIIRVENSIYKACPVESCKKKLVDQSTGIFRCEKCNKDYPNFVYRLLASMNIADATGSRWITAFNEEAEKILGMSAQELGELKENDNDAYMQKFGDASFKRFTFALRVKSEVFQDEMRMRHTCVSISPVNYNTYMTHLLNKICKLAHIEKLED
ncbi:PREDICTED: replication protein A 70 kDa DNA-binding subunit [Dinoponera quadriceps]|uniref:Replication protein A subunit n=1 Tax=Dinoponera quadriceps TaxID=609295 RepID=A0A6P3XHV6_DINQU|nr:PREDICTED: replication protein A 70 kDa DNA-binding subunit [Dinoponera quadriceps]